MVVTQVAGGQLRELVDEFIGRDIAPGTADSYGYPLRGHFLPWCASRGVTTPEELVPDVIDAFGRMLQAHTTARGTPLRPASRRTYMKAVQQFLSWLRQRKRIEEVDPKLVQLPRRRRQHRQVLSRAEIQQLEDAARIERDKLIIRIMADTATREGGVARLLRTDVIRQDGRYCFLRVADKTGERMPPISAELYRRLKAHAEGKTGRPRSGDPHLFLATRRRPGGDYEPLTEDGLYQAVRDVAARARLGKRVYPHLLCHSALTWMVNERGISPIVVAESTGRSLSVIMEYYNHPSDQQRWEAMRQLWA